MGEADDVAFDPVIHAPARLKIMMLLATEPAAAFNDLARDAGLTPGNLAAHLKALENAGYVHARRSLIDLKPRMRYAMTHAGRVALVAYCRALERAVRALQGVTGAEGATDGGRGGGSGKPASDPSQPRHPSRNQSRNQSRIQSRNQSRNGRASGAAAPICRVRPA